MTAPGKESELEVLYSSQAVYTPGPENVNATIDGPVDIGNTVDVTGSVAIQQDIVSLFAAVVSVVPNNSANVASVVTSPYSCVYIQIQDPNLPGALDIDKEYTVRVGWDSINPGIGADEVGYDEFTLNFQSRASVCLTVKGDVMNVSFSSWFGVVATRNMYLGIQGIKMALPEFYQHQWRMSGVPYVGFANVNRVNTQGNFNMLAEHPVTVERCIIPINHYSGYSQLARILHYQIAGTPTVLDYSWTEASDREQKIYGNVITAFPAAYEIRTTNDQMYLPRRPIVYQEFLYGPAGVRVGLRISQWFMGVNAEK